MASPAAAAPRHSIAFITQTERRKVQAQFAELLSTFTEPIVACSRLGISYAVYRQWKLKDAYFQDLLRDAAERRTETLEKEAWRRALAGSDALMIFMLKAARPDTYRERASLEISGPNGSPLELGDAQRAAKILALVAAAERDDSPDTPLDPRARAPEIVDAEWRHVDAPALDGSDLV